MKHLSSWFALSSVICWLIACTPQKVAKSVVVKKVLNQYLYYIRPMPAAAAILELYNDSTFILAGDLGFSNFSCHKGKFLISNDTLRLMVNFKKIIVHQANVNTWYQLQNFVNIDEQGRVLIPFETGKDSVKISFYSNLWAIETGLPEYGYEYLFKKEKYLPKLFFHNYICPDSSFLAQVQYYRANYLDKQMKKKGYHPVMRNHLRK
jgi:hypothetical protein